jgi:hypothetical protein
MNERVRTALAQLEEAREALLEYADGVWQSIDNRDNEQVQKKVPFVTACNDKLVELGRLTDDLGALVRDYLGEPVDAEGEAPSTDAERNARVIRELDRGTPHTIDEVFSYKRPYGFKLRGRAAKDIRTWRRLYALVCLQLAELAPATFAALPDDAQFTTPQGHRAFSRSRADLRSALLLRDGIYAEAHYSANGVARNLRRLLAAFRVNPNELTIYLRQDRDAGRDEVA